MKATKPSRSFIVEVGESALLGVSPESALTIKLINRRTGKDTMTYSASVEWIHQAMARKFQRENPTPTGKPRRRRLLTSSEQMRA